MLHESPWGVWALAGPANRPTGTLIIWDNGGPQPLQKSSGKDCRHNALRPTSTTTTAPRTDAGG